MRVVVAYLAICWALVAGLSQLQTVFEDEMGLAWYGTMVMAILVVGTALSPLVAFLAWKYDIVPPQLVRDIKDIEAENPGLSWARVRHDTKDAGFVLLSWTNSDGGTSEKRYFQPVSIGRDPSNDIELGDERVSRHHAVLWAENGVWHIRDLDSANGTFIGHTRVSGTQALPLACELRFHVNGPILSLSVARAAATRVG